MLLPKALFSPYHPRPPSQPCHAITEDPHVAFSSHSPEALFLPQPLKALLSPHHYQGSLLALFFLPKPLFWSHLLLLIIGWVTCPSVHFFLPDAGGARPYRFLSLPITSLIYRLTRLRRIDSLSRH